MIGCNIVCMVATVAAIAWAELILIFSENDSSFLKWTGVHPIQLLDIIAWQRILSLVGAGLSFCVWASVPSHKVRATALSIFVGCVIGLAFLLFSPDYAIEY
jgi:hypothetical protein